MAVLRKLLAHWDIILALMISLLMGAVYFWVNTNELFGFISLGAVFFALSRGWERVTFRLACHFTHPKGYWFYQSSNALYGLLVAGGMMTFSASGWVYAVFFLYYIFALNSMMWVAERKRRYKDLGKEIYRVYQHDYRDPLVKGYAKSVQEETSSRGEQKIDSNHKEL